MGKKPMGSEEIMTITTRLCRACDGDGIVPIYDDVQPHERRTQDSGKGYVNDTTTRDTKAATNNRQLP